MNTQHNYIVEIWTNSGKTNADIGLLDGMYTWILSSVDDTESLFPYKDDIIKAGGISPLMRSCDSRTGGGLSAEQNVSITILGGFYSDIVSTDPILGKRVKIYDVTWNETNSEYDRELRYTGAMQKPDIQGFETVLNCTVESKNRDVELPASSRVFGRGEIVGEQVGTIVYETAGGYKALFNVTSVAREDPDRYTVYMGGATPSSEALIDSSYVNRLTVLSKSEEGLYIDGAENYKVDNVVGVSSGGVVTLALYVNRGATGDKIGGLTAEIATLYSGEEAAYYGGATIDEFTIDKNGSSATVEDANNTIFETAAGYIFKDDLGEAQSRAYRGEDYDADLEKFPSIPLLSAVPDITRGGDGYYYRVAPAVSGTSASLVVGGTPQNPSYNVTKWDNNATQKNSVSVFPGSGWNSPTRIGAYHAIEYKLNKTADIFDSLSMVVDANVSSVLPYNEGEGIVFDEGASFEIFFAMYSDGKALGSDVSASDLIGEGQVRVLIPQEGFPIVTTTTNVPEENSSVADNQNLAFHDGEIYGTYEGLGAIECEIGQYFEEIDGVKYTDGVRIFIAAGTTQRASLSGLTISSPPAYTVEFNQINLVKGYSINSVSDLTAIIDNSGLNDTIPRAYTDIVKRQNLNGINAIAPVDGWGTAQVDEDGAGNPIEGSYLMNDIPTGVLEGTTTQSTVKGIKKEIARCVPAISLYDKNGVETLRELGSFSFDGTVITYPMIKGDLDIKGYEGKDIQPSLSFEFGTDKKRLQVNNVEADAYDESFIVDDLGLSDYEKTYLWNAGHALYLLYGISTTQTAKKYTIVNDADGAYRIAVGLYANMGYFQGVSYPRDVLKFSAEKSVLLDMGQDVVISAPQYTGIGYISNIGEQVFGGLIPYTVEALDTIIPSETSDILQTGSQADDVLQTGTQTDDILQRGI